MKRRLMLVLVCAVLCTVVLGSGCGAKRYSGPYLGEQPPGTTPKLFAPSAFKAEVHGVSQFSPDGSEMYWSTMSGETAADYTTQLNYMRLENGTWTAPAAAPFSRAKDDCPTLSADGSRLFFLRNDGDKERIYVIDRVSGGWSPPVALPDAVNSLAVHWQISVTTNGDLYFSGSIAGETEARDIYCAEADGQYAKVTKLGSTVNTDQLEFSPYIARDGSCLLITRCPSSQNPSDIFVSFRSTDGSWGEAIRLPESVNGPSNELCPWVSDDGKYLFFLSQRDNSSRIYWVDASVIESVRPK